MCKMQTTGRKEKPYRLNVMRDDMVDLRRDYMLHDGLNDLGDMIPHVGVHLGRDDRMHHGLHVVVDAGGHGRIVHLGLVHDRLVRLVQADVAHERPGTPRTVAVRVVVKVGARRRRRATSHAHAVVAVHHRVARVAQRRLAVIVTVVVIVVLHFNF